MHVYETHLKVKIRKQVYFTCLLPVAGLKSNMSCSGLWVNYIVQVTGLAWARSKSIPEKYQENKDEKEDCAISAKKSSDTICH